MPSKLPACRNKIEWGATSDEQMAALSIPTLYPQLLLLWDVPTALASEGARYDWATQPDSWGSDHLLIIITPVGGKIRRTRQCSTVDWRVFRQRLRDTPGDQDFLGLVAAAAQAATIQSQVPENHPAPDLRHLNLRAARRRAERRYLKAQNPEHRTLFNRVDAVCRQHANRRRRQSWQGICHSLSQARGSSRAWRLLRSLVIGPTAWQPVLAVAIRLGISEQELAERLADRFAAQPVGQPSAITTAPSPKPPQGHHPTWTASQISAFFSQTAVGARRLNRFVRHFEPLSYEPRTVHRGHVRVRRSLGGSQPQQQQQNSHVYVRFQGFNRLFHLKLRPDTTVFDKDLVVETTMFGRVKPNIDHIYSGEVVGDPSSRVYGGLHNGVFEGSIQSRWGRFYVEGAHKFFARRMPFHSVMYAAEDAGIPPPRVVRRQRRDYAMDAAAGRRLRTGAESRVQGSSRVKRHSSDHLERWIGRRPLEQQEQSEYSYYDSDVDVGDVDDKQAEKGDTDRRRRSKRARRSHRTYRVCGLYVQIDHLLYRQFAQIDNDAVRTRERLSTLIAGHAARASDIFRHTDFNGIEDINDTTSCPGKKNPFCLDKMDPALFLLTAAKSANFDEYCLSYTWTYRDFDSGVLGPRLRGKLDE
ncbi:hypothetical protein MTO96_021740 [Rhipicephalus appendiculatus]